MIRIMLLVFSAAVAMTPLPAVAAEEDARATAEKALAEGVRMFDAKDAVGLTRTYTDDATITALTRESGTRELKTEVHRGSEEIEKVYNKLFEGDATFHSRNTIDAARLVGPDVIVITGTFSPDTQATEPLSIPFVQVRTKKGDSWKIANLQIFILLEK